MQIIVLGMHRSGTSTLARILNLLGCYFGSEEVSIGVASDNPKGFWERSDVIDINDYILSAAGGNWWDVSSLDFSSIGSDDLAWIHKRIADVVVKLDAYRPWFIKDPRLCLTLDFWLPFLEKPVFIHSRRSPVQAAKSLLRRNGIPLEYGMALWEFYTRSMLHSLGDSARISVAYEDLLRSPFETTVHLYESLLTFGVEGLHQPNRGEIESFVEPKLCHFEDGNERTRLTFGQQNLLMALDEGNTTATSLEQAATMYETMQHAKVEGEWATSLSAPVIEETLVERIKKITAYNAELVTQYAELQAVNSVLQARCDEQELRLSGISHSRIVSVIVMGYRLLGLGGRGLAAELRRVDAARDGGCTLSHSGAGKFKVAVRLIRHAAANPSLIFKILQPRRIKNAYIFLLRNKGGMRLLMKRCEELYLRPQLAVDEASLCGAQHLIDRYQLPVTSEDGVYVLPSNDDVRKWADDLQRLEMSLFQKSNVSTEISIIVPVYNQIRYTLACVHSILVNAGRMDFEIIIADDGSNDQTSDVFNRGYSRIFHHRNETNLGFLRNCNEAAKKARGRYLVLLNNDTVVLPGWLSELIRTFDDNNAVGLVGSKLMYPDGRLQEAGGIVFEDGSGWNYGRLQDSTAPQYNYMRDVDYCSGASLAITAALWRQLGGFDERFTPAYYEDTDLAFQVRMAGKRVVYQPLSAVLHFEGISNGKSEDAGVKQHQLENKPKFHSKWSEVLASYGVAAPCALPYNRSSSKRILIIDATTPTPDRDSGSLDAFNYMTILKDLKMHITFVPNDLVSKGSYTKDIQRLGVEVACAPYIFSVEHAIRHFAPSADVVILCRANVAASLLSVVRKHGPNAKILFDTVDLHFLRESREAVLFGSARLERSAQSMRNMELDVIRKSDATIVRSDYEMEVIRTFIPDANLYRIPIVRDFPQMISVDWSARKDVVFIGGFNHPPNVDAVHYLVSEVWPILRAAHFPGKLIIAGSDLPKEIEMLASNDILIRGFVPHLEDLFGACRVSVAPLRYGAGMKGKVITSLSYGVPCVATSIAAEGAGLVNGEHILVEDDPNNFAMAIMRIYGDKLLWNKISEAGVEYFKKNFTMASVKQQINQLLSDLIPSEKRLDHELEKRT